MKKLEKNGVSVTDCNYWPQYLPNDSDQWLQSKPWTTSIGQCVRYCTGPSAQLSKRLAITLLFLIVVSFAVALVAAGVKQREYSPGGGIQWLPG
jgi:hypothetical protein